MANGSVHTSQRELEDESHQEREEAIGATVPNGTIKHVVRNLAFIVA
jgi:hypothetical protein